MSKLGGVPWAKYKGELHIPSYNFCGPNTSLKDRISENDQPTEGNSPINQTDAVCYKHDLAYREAGDNLDKKHKADKIMIQELDQVKPNSFKEKIIKSLISTTMKGKVKLGLGLVVMPLEYRNFI